MTSLPLSGDEIKTHALPHGEGVLISKLVGKKEILYYYRNDSVRAYELPNPGLSNAFYDYFYFQLPGMKKNSYLTLSRSKENKRDSLSIAYDPDDVHVKRRS
jgi:hypothetical protein